MMKIKINIFTFITLVLSYYNVFSQNETQLIFKGTATGTNNYTVTVSATTYPSLLDAKEILVKVPNVNTTSVTITTINSNGVNYGTRNIYLNGNNLSGGELTVGIYHRLVYNSALSRWDLDKSGIPPVGTPITIGSGTGINVSGTYPSFTVTNTSPDQSVVLNNGTGISATGTYPNFTITNTSPDQSVTISNGTGIVVGGAYPTFTVTNSSPDVPVTLTPGTGMSITGSYPSYTVTNTSPSSGGTVTTFTITPNQGVSGMVTNPTTTPSAQIILGAITPSISVTSPISTFSTSTTTPKIIMQGSSSGTTTVTVPSTAGSYTLTLPPTDGNALEFLQTDGNGTTIWAPSTSSQWTTTGSDIYYNTGNVGIGNSSPDAKLDVVSTSTVNPVASFSVNTSGSTNATGVNINAEGGTTTDALVVNSKSNVSGGINNAIVALATTANGGYNNAFTSVAQNGDYNYGAKVIAQGGVDAVGLSISASGASGNNNAIDITSGNLKYTPGSEGAGKVLTSDANGVASWQTPSAGGSASVTITDDNSTNATMYPTWVAANSGSQPVKVSSTKMIFNPSTGWIGLNTTSPLGGLDISHNGYNSGNASLVLGADGGSFNLYTRTNSTTKLGTIAFPHYLNAEEPFTFVYGTSTSTNNILYIGGGLAQQNAATQIRFYPGATYTTTTGTPMATITTTGLGINTLSYQSLLQVVGTGSTSATSSVKILNSANDTIFKIRDDGKLFYKDGNQAAGKVLTSNAIGMATWTTPSSGSVSSVDISGGTTGLTFSGGPITTAGTFTTSGTLAIANGGTGATTANAAFNALSPNTTRGDITGRNATVNARLALGAAGTILRSDGTDLAYSTATYPNTTTANQILYSSATNTLGGSANLTYDGTTFSTPVASHSTSLKSPLIIGGSGTTQSLTYKTTTGVGTTGADHIFTSGNNGATEIARFTNAGAFLVGKTAPTTADEIVGFRKNYAGTTLSLLENTNASGMVVHKIQGDQKAASFGMRNSAMSPAGVLAPNDAYMYGNTNLSFWADGGSSVIKWSTGSSTEKMRLDASGRLGIGTTSPASQLDVEGGVAIGATYSGTTAAPTNGLTVQGSVGIGTATVATTNKVQIESTGGGDGTSHIGIQYTGTQSGASSVLYGIRSDISGGLVTFAVRGNNSNTQASSSNYGARFTVGGVGGTSNTGVDAEATGATTNVGLKVTSSTNTDYGIQITSEDYALVTAGGKVGIGTTTPTELFQVSGTASVSITSDGKIIQNDLITYNQLVSVADDGTFDIPAGTTGWCEVIAGVSSTIDGAIAFRFTNDGAVVETRVADAIASATADTDTKLCAFDNGSNVRIKNRLGGTRDLLIKLTYR